MPDKQTTPTATATAHARTRPNGREDHDLIPRSSELPEPHRPEPVTTRGVAR